MHSGTADGVSCIDDQDVVSKMSKVVQKEAPQGKSGKFVWGQLRAVSQFYEMQTQQERQQAAAERARTQLEASNATQDQTDGKDVKLIPASLMSIIHL